MRKGLRTGQQSQKTLGSLRQRRGSFHISDAQYGSQQQRVFRQRDRYFFNNTERVPPALQADLYQESGNAEQDTDCGDGGDGSQRQTVWLKRSEAKRKADEADIPITSVQPIEPCVS